jgi:two-component system sensor histidine kinase AtoS
MVLVFVVVGVMVWLLAERMRADAQHLRTAYEKLHAAQKKLLEEERLAAIGRLASAVAHEIRNPVAMIASALETAHRKETDTAIREEFCDIAAKESRRLERITTDFLAYARSKPPERASQSLETTVGYVAALVAARLAEHKLQLELRVQPHASGHFDPFQIHQALLNLIANALDHTPNDGTVIIGANETDHAVEFYVQNSGAPVQSPEDAFDPFFTTKPRGTGLGLSISRKIAEAHGGTLELTHNLPGQVRFTITIPRQQR